MCGSRYPRDQGSYSYSTRGVASGIQPVNQLLGQSCLFHAGRMNCDDLVRSTMRARSQVTIGAITTDSYSLPTQTVPVCKPIEPSFSS